MMERLDIAKALTKAELVKTLSFIDECLVCTREKDFNRSIVDFAAFLGFEFVLYGFKKTSYDRTKRIHLVNISNPLPWMQEYEERKYLGSDPVRIELERRLALRESCGAFVWDAYDRKLTAAEREVIRQRKSYGLQYGFSAFCNSRGHDATFLFSFASKTKKADKKSLMLGIFIAPHLNRCRKRIDLMSLVGSLTRREKAVADWLIEGKTNWEIATILDVTESTVKYHVANILTKLEAGNRQSAVSILMAERYLSSEMF